MAARKNDHSLPELAVRMYNGGNGLGYRAIGRMLGVHHLTVKYYIRQAGQLVEGRGTLPVEAPTTPPQRPVKRNDPTLPKQVRRMSEDGLSQAAIARALGVCVGTVRYHLRRDAETLPDVTPAERPTCWVCAAPSVDWDGHPQCRGKKVA